MQKRVLDWVVDRGKLLVTALVIGFAILSYCFLILKVLPQPIGTAVSLLVVFVLWIGYVSRCKQLRLSVWTGLPLPSAVGDEWRTEDLEGKAAPEHNDTP
jgi:hypothetical protein